VVKIPAPGENLTALFPSPVKRDLRNVEYWDQIAQAAKNTFNGRSELTRKRGVSLFPAL